MSLASMTGFARAVGAAGAYSWVWELKSVNNRGLDIRVRVPSGMEALDLEARKRVGAKLKRGSLQVGLQVTRAEGVGGLSVNEAALSQVLDAINRLRGTIEAAPPRLDGLLSIRGVLDFQEPEETEEEREAREAAMLGTLEEAIDGLVKARREEGKALAALIGGHLSQVETLLGRAEALSALQPDKLKKRLTDQLAQLMEANAGLPEDRIAQEAALLMTKADVREELDRLKAHIAGARELLASGEAVGRRFDFLTQEFNREANTLCSKSPDIELTKVGLDLKAVIDQMREQVQNVE